MAELAEVSYSVVRSDDELETLGGNIYKVRRALGAKAFGINELRFQGGATGFAHDESQTEHEEVYFIIEGDAIFTVGEDDIELQAGDYLRVDPLEPRVFVAGGDGVRMIVVGARRREVYDGRATL